MYCCRRSYKLVNNMVVAFGGAQSSMFFSGSHKAASSLSQGQRCPSVLLRAWCRAAADKQQQGAVSGTAGQAKPSLDASRAQSSAAAPFNRPQRPPPEGQPQGKSRPQTAAMGRQPQGNSRSQAETTGRQPRDSSGSPGASARGKAQEGAWSRRGTGERLPHAPTGAAGPPAAAKPSPAPAGQSSRPAGAAATGAQGPAKPPREPPQAPPPAAPPRGAPGSGARAQGGAPSEAPRSSPQASSVQPPQPPPPAHPAPRPGAGPKPVPAEGAAPAPATGAETAPGTGQGGGQLQGAGALVAPQPDTQGPEEAPATPSQPGLLPQGQLPPGDSDLTVRDQLNKRGITLSSYQPGTYRQLCPWCKGGSDGEKSLTVTIEGGEVALWHCHRATCGEEGGFTLETVREGETPGEAPEPLRPLPKVLAPGPVQEYARPDMPLDPLTDQAILEFFKGRGISAATLQRNGVAQTLRYSPAAKDKVPHICFPYYRGPELVNVKTRSLAKEFCQVKGCEKIVYGLNDLAGASEAIIVEGEMDKLALEEAGFRHVISVPNGAVARVKEGQLPPAGEDKAFDYLWNCRGVLDRIERVVLATDSDGPGQFLGVDKKEPLGEQALQYELARRLGRERCWRVHWRGRPRDQIPPGAAPGPSPPGGGGPSPNGAAGPSASRAPQSGAGSSLNGSTPHGVGPPHPGTGPPGPHSVNGVGGALGAVHPASPGAAEQDAEGYRKDANEVLVMDGPEWLQELIQGAEEYPIRGLIRFKEYEDELWESYGANPQEEQGCSSGWAELNPLYRVIPGELTVVTGVPNSGKSEWLDALMVNLAKCHGWSFGLCSMEKKAIDHLRQLMEKVVKKPFFETGYSAGIPRMSRAEARAGLEWVDERFHLIRYEDEALPSVDWVLDVARTAVLRHGIRGLVIDPYNELDHGRSMRESETEFVSQMLTKMKRFAAHNDVHLWLVAHPRQLQQWHGEAPGLYDISGSAHFVNKADNGIVVHRNREAEDPEERAQVQIILRKVRNKHAGQTGECILKYHRPTGRYYSPGGRYDDDFR